MLRLVSRTKHTVQPRKQRIWVLYEMAWSLRECGGTSPLVCVCVAPCRQKARAEKGLPADKPNVIICNTYQVAWKKLAVYFDIELRLGHVSEGKYTLQPEVSTHTHTHTYTRTQAHLSTYAHTMCMYLHGQRYKERCAPGVLTVSMCYVCACACACVCVCVCVCARRTSRDWRYVSTSAGSSYTHTHTHTRAHTRALSQAGAARALCARHVSFCALAG